MFVSFLYFYLIGWSMSPSTLTALSGHFLSFSFLRITVTKPLRNAVVALLDIPHIGTARKRGRSFKALLDNASVKVMQDDSSSLSELHMGLSLTR